MPPASGARTGLWTSQTPPFPPLELIRAETGCCSTGARCRGACFGRGLHQPTLTSSYGIEEGVAVIGTEAPLLPVPTIKVRAPVLEVSEDLSWELDGQALGGLPWDGGRSGELWRRGREMAFPSALHEHRAGDLSQGSKHSLSHCGSCPPLYGGGKDPSVPSKTMHQFPWLQTSGQQVQPSTGGPGTHPTCPTTSSSPTAKVWAHPHRVPCM